MVKKVLAAAAVFVGVLGLVGASAAGAAGPKQEVIGGNPAFVCEGDAGLPPNHCVNVKGRGDTGVILVFLPDERGPQESVSTNPKADTRPCPQDPGADEDGTWWSPADGLYVCHHRP